MSERGTDRRVLQEEAYADGNHLRTRMDIYRYREEPLDFPAEALAHAPVAVGGDVLDVGCGAGAYLMRLATARRVVAVDLSVGMLADTRSRLPDAADGWCNADVQHLPFASASFDVVLAMHMLYHAPDRARAVDELARVVRPDGTVLVATNGARHHEETDALVRAAHLAVTGENLSRERVSLGFTLEDAEGELGRRFASHTVRWVGRLVVPEAAPVVAYVASMTSLIGDLPEATHTRMLAEVERIVQERIDHDGAWRITTEAGVVVCVPR